MLRFARQFQTRQFQTSALRRVAVGDAVPSAALHAGSPSETVDLHEKTALGSYLIVGVPGAFSPGCSQRHIPEYLKQFAEFKKNGIKHIYVVTVNDSFVTNAWTAGLLETAATPGAEDFVDVLADASGDFSRQWDTLFDASKFFGNERTKRYAALVQNGKVTKAFVEPDSTGIDVSEASKVLQEL